MATEGLTLQKMRESPTFDPRWTLGLCILPSPSFLTAQGDICFFFSKRWCHWKKKVGGVEKGPSRRGRCWCLVVLQIRVFSMAAKKLTNPHEDNKKKGSVQMMAGGWICKCQGQRPAKSRGWCEEKNRLRGREPDALLQNVSSMGNYYIFLKLHAQVMHCTI